jgi:ribosomal protein S18 acetylase RimI-like enzyme
MPTWGYERDPRETRAINLAIDAHLRRRGIPEHALSDARYKWIRNKGFRAPR